MIRLGLLIDREPRWPFLIGPLAAGLLLLFFLSSELGDLSGDSARYLLLGQALATGQGYVELEKPGHPPHTEYAPGLPVLLAPLLRLGGAQAAADPLRGSWLVVCKMIPVLALLLSVFLLSQLALATNTVRSNLSAAGFATLLAATPFLSRFANQVLSDLPYLAASLLALLYLYRLRARPKPSAAAWLFAGLLISVSFFFRQLGLALWLGALVGAVLRPGPSLREKMFPAGMLSIGFGVPVGAWLIRNYLAAGGVDPGHLAKMFAAQDGNPLLAAVPAGALVPRTLQGLAAYVRETGSILLDMMGVGWPDYVLTGLGAAAFALIVPGFLARLWKERGPLEWYSLFYFLLISAWQSHNPRYLIPLLPSGLIFAARGIRLLEESFSSPRRNRAGRFGPATVLVFLVLNLAVLVGDLRLIRSAPRNPAIDLFPRFGAIHWGRWYQYPDFLRSGDPAGMARGYHRLLAVADFLRSQPGSALIVTRKPQLVAWVSGRSTMQYPPYPAPDAFLAALRERNATHVLLDEVSPGVRALFEKVRQARPGAFEEVFTIGHTTLIKIKSP